MLSFGDTNPAPANRTSSTSTFSARERAEPEQLRDVRFRSGWTADGSTGATKQMSENVKASAYSASRTRSRHRTIRATNNTGHQERFLELEALRRPRRRTQRRPLHVGGIISTINISTAAMGLGNTCGVGATTSPATPAATA